MALILTKSEAEAFVNTTACAQNAGASNVSLEFIKAAGRVAKISTYAINGWTIRIRVGEFDYEYHSTMNAFKRAYNIEG